MIESSADRGTDLIDEMPVAPALPAEPVDEGLHDVEGESGVGRLFLRGGQHLDGLGLDTPIEAVQEGLGQFDVDV